MSATNTTLSTIRTAGQQSLFFKKLFLSGNTGLSAATITAEFRAICKLAGVDLPQDVLITLDVAQCIFAGGVIVDSIDEAASVGSVACPIVAGIQALSALLADLGVLDSQTADWVGWAGTASLAISNFGANIPDDIANIIYTLLVVKDLVGDFTGSQSAADAEAHNSLATGIRAYANPQIANAAAAAKQYTAGTLNFFDFVESIAINSPIEFKQFFPKLAVYFPSWVTETVTGTGQSEGWTSTKYATTQYTFNDVLVTNDAQVRAVLLDYFIVQPLKKFSQYETKATTISLKSMCYLSMLLSTTPGGPVQMDLNFDVLRACGLLGLTPFILGDDWLFKGLTRNENVLDDWADFLPYPALTLPAIQRPTTNLVINGVPFYTDQEKLESDACDGLTGLQKFMQQLDSRGEIGALLKIPEAVAMLKQWASIRIDPSYGADGEVDNLVLKPNCASVTKQPWFVRGNNNEQTWEYIRANYTLEIDDYWKCLGVLKSMEKSQLFNPDEKSLEQYGDVDALQAGFKKVYLFTLAKNLNRLARQNVAQSLNIPVTELAQKRNPDGSSVFYRKVPS